MTIGNIRGAAFALTFLLMATASYGQTAAQSAAPAAPPPPDAQTAAPAPFPKEKLDQMLAPIALYPDQLVTNILMAASYPQDVADAAKWLKEGTNGSLKDDALLDAIRPLPWDPSVKFLLPFPQLVQQLNDQPNWAQDLGDAFVYQQTEVMGEVQHLRQLSMSCGKLKSTAQIRVRRERGAITIAPANPGVVYVPVYNPAVVYGAWAYPAYPPVYFAPQPGFVLAGAGFGLDVGIGYSFGFGVVGPLWGWSRPNWGGGFVNVDYAQMNRFSSYNRTVINERFAGGAWNHAAVGRFAAADRFSRHDNGRHVGWSHSAHGGHGYGHEGSRGGGHEGRGHGGHGGGHEGGGHGGHGGGHEGGGHGGHGGGHEGGGHGGHGGGHEGGGRGGHGGGGHEGGGHGGHGGGGHEGGGHGGHGGGGHDKGKGGH